MIKTRWNNTIKYDKVEPLPRMIKKTNVLYEDWDNLIVLDACRYDAFKKINDIPGKLSYINSVGSSTGEWTLNTFKEKYPDVTYITTNPHISKKLLPNICGFIPFEDLHEVHLDKWNEITQTVHPKDVVDYVNKLKVRKKRMVIHFMQPHHPFLGKKKIEALGYVQWKYGAESDNMGDTVWDLLAKKKITREEAWEAYLSNLEMVLKYIKEMLPNLKGKTIITADHGNCFGEYGLVCHPRGYEYPELIKVPYFEVKI